MSPGREIGMVAVIVELHNGGVALHLETEGMPAAAGAAEPGVRRFVPVADFALLRSFFRHGAVGNQAVAVNVEQQAAVDRVAPRLPPEKAVEKHQAAARRFFRVLPAQGQHLIHLRNFAVVGAFLHVDAFIAAIDIPPVAIVIPHLAFFPAVVGVSRILSPEIRPFFQGDDVVKAEIPRLRLFAESLENPGRDRRGRRCSRGGRFRR